MKYKAVIADVDGTIMEPSELPAKKPGRKLIESVFQLQKKGVIFTLASGRSKEWLMELISGLHLTAPVILDNGARIYDPVGEKYIYDFVIPKTAAKKY